MNKYETFILQDKIELQQLADFVKEQGFRSYLEIGSKFGGSLWKIANAMPAGSRVVSIDLPWVDGSFKDSQPWLEKCVSRLQDMGYITDLLIGDSHLPSSVEFAQR